MRGRIDELEVELRRLRGLMSEREREAEKTRDLHNKSMRRMWRTAIEVHGALDGAGAGALEAAHVGEQSTLGAMRTMRAQVLVAKCLEEWTAHVERRRNSRKDFILGHTYEWMLVWRRRRARARACSRGAVVGMMRARRCAAHAPVRPCGCATRRQRTAARCTRSCRSSGARACSSRCPRSAAAPSVRAGERSVRITRSPAVPRRTQENWLRVYQVAPDEEVKIEELRECPVCYESVDWDREPPLRACARVQRGLNWVAVGSDIIVLNECLHFLCSECMRQHVTVQV